MRKQDEDLNVKPEALLWLDFETTGTDRNDSLPLEVGMECTDVLGEHSYGDPCIASSDRTISTCWA